MFIPLRNIGTVSWADPCWDCRRIFKASLNGSGQIYNFMLKLDYTCWDDEAQRNWVNKINYLIRNNQSTVKTTTTEIIKSTSGYIENTHSATSAKAGKTQIKKRIDSLNKEVKQINSELTLNESERHAASASLKAEDIKIANLNKQLSDILLTMNNDAKSLKAKDLTEKNLTKNLSNATTIVTECGKKAKDSEAAVTSSIAKLRKETPGNNSGKKIDAVANSFKKDDAAGVITNLSKIVS